MQISGHYLPSNSLHNVGAPPAVSCTKRADYLRAAVYRTYCQVRGRTVGSSGGYDLVDFPQAQEGHRLYAVHAAQPTPRTPATA